MRLAKFIEEKSPVGEGERALSDDEITELHSGFNFGTTGIERVELWPCDDLEINSAYAIDRPPMQIRVVRQSVFGKLRRTNPPVFTSYPNHELIKRLNDPKVLRRASNNERIAQIVVGSLGAAVVGIAYATKKYIKPTRVRL